jgi:hypothetical protein
MAFEMAGANAVTVHSLRDAFRHFEQDGLLPKAAKPQELIEA